MTLGTVEKLLEPGLVCVLFRAGTEIDVGGLKWHSNSQCLGQLAGFRDQDGAGWQQVLEIGGTLRGGWGQWSLSQKLPLVEKLLKFLQGTFF